MRIIINNVGEAYFILTKPADISRKDEFKLQLIILDTYATKIQKHDELKMFLMLFPFDNCEQTEEFNGKIYELKKEKHIIKVVNAVIESSFFLHKDNLEHFPKLFTDFLILNPGLTYEIAMDKAIRWYLRLLHAMVSKHEYTLNGGGVSIPELNKALSTHASEIYTHVDKCLQDSTLISQQGFTEFHSFTVSRIKPLTQPASGPQPIFALSNAAAYTRTVSTRQLYLDIIHVFEKSKTTLEALHKHFNDKSVALEKEESIAHSLRKSS